MTTVLGAGALIVLAVALCALVAMPYEPDWWD